MLKIKIKNLLLFSKKKNKGYLRSNTPHTHIPTRPRAPQPHAHTDTRAATHAPTHTEGHMHFFNLMLIMCVSFLLFSYYFPLLF